MSIVKLLLLIHFTSIKWKMTWSQIIKDHRTIVASMCISCNAFWQRGNNQTIKGQFSYGTVFASKWYANKTLFCFVLLRRTAILTHVLFHFLISLYKFQGGIVCIGTIIVASTHASRFLLTLIFPRLEFQNYSHVLSVYQVCSMWFFVFMFCLCLPLLVRIRYLHQLNEAINLVIFDAVAIEQTDKNTWTHSKSGLKFHSLSVCVVFYSVNERWKSAWKHQLNFR